jgi:hypothetical protein
MNMSPQGNCRTALNHYFLKNGERKKMKNGAVVLGIFIMAGLIIGAFVISLVGQEKQQANDLNPDNDRIEGLARRMETFEQKISELEGKLAEYFLLLDANNRSVMEFKDQLAAAQKGAETTQADANADDKLARGLDPVNRDVLENIKEEVKREIKEENRTARRKKESAGVKKWADSQTTQLQKRMDEKFLGFAQRIKLDRNQEIAVKDITENLIKQVSTIWSNWEDRLSEGMTDEDWGEFKGELGEVYDNAHQQLLEHVSERQAGAIMGFIQGGKK